jgi:hypothetical protein
MIALIVLIGTPKLFWERVPVTKFSSTKDLGSFSVVTDATKVVALPDKALQNLFIKAYNLTTGEDISATMSCVAELKAAKKFSFIDIGFQKQGEIYRPATFSLRDPITKKTMTRVIFVNRGGTIFISTKSTKTVTGKSLRTIYKHAALCGTLSPQLYRTAHSNEFKDKLASTFIPALNVSIRSGAPTSAISVTASTAGTYQLFIGRSGPTSGMLAKKGTSVGSGSREWLYRAEIVVSNKQGTAQPPEPGPLATAAPPSRPTELPSHTPTTTPTRVPTSAAYDTPTRTPYLPPTFTAAPPPTKTSTPRPTMTPTKTATPTATPVPPPAPYTFDFETFVSSLVEDKLRVKGRCDSRFELRFDNAGWEPKATIPCVNNAYDYEFPKGSLNFPRTSYNGIKPTLRSNPPGDPTQSTIRFSYTLKRKPFISDFIHQGSGLSLMPRSPSQRTLVLFNTNVTTAAGIAAYYAEKRSIPATNLCGVPFVPGHYASLEEYLGVKKKILSECICPLAKSYQPSLNCDTALPSELQKATLIDNLVFIRGWPARITFDKEDPSLDAFMTQDLFADASDLLPPFVVHWGRIDGVTAERAKLLVDRALQSEALGLQANLITESTPFQFALRYGDTITNTCKENLEGRLAWDAAQCAVGYESTGIVPSYPGAQLFGKIIPNIQFFFGGNPWPNGQDAFNAYWPGMLKWRKGSSSCVELCKDLPTANEREACRQNSTDYFRIINSNCVGAAPGFIGSQVRSYVVNHFGFFPQGYNAEFFGDYENSPPQMISTGMVGDSYDYKLRFGMDDAVANPMCFDQNTNSIPCDERLPLSMYRSYTPKATAAVVDGDLRLSASIDVRNKKFPGGAVVIRLLPTLTDGTALPERVLPILLDNERAELQKVTTQAVWTGLPSGTSVKTLVIDWRSSFNSRGFYEVDNLGVFNAQGEPLLSQEESTFSELHDKLTVGTWATNTIERLGATAWWGSSSHYLTGGGAFGQQKLIFDALLNGKTLGESVNRGRSIESGLFYGDSLYNPAGAYLSVRGPKLKVLAEPFEWENYDSKVTPTTVIREDSFYSIEGVNDALFSNSLEIVAFNGSAAPTWEVDFCEDRSGPRWCDAGNKWTRVKSGNGPIRELSALGITPGSFVTETSKVSFLNFRLSVKAGSNPTLRSYLMLKFIP